MSNATQRAYVKDTWQNTRNTRTLRALMALRNEEIAARVRELRERAGLTQVEFAHALRTAERTVQGWERAEAVPQFRSLRKLSEFGGVTEAWILEGVDTRPQARGVPEQLETVDEKFTRLVEGVRDQLDALEELMQTNNDLIRRVLAMVDEGLFLNLQHEAPADDRRHEHDDQLRTQQLGLGAALAAAFRAANPEAVQEIQRALLEQASPSGTRRAQQTRRATG